MKKVISKFRIALLPATFLCLINISHIAFSQNIAITDDDGYSPHASAMLDVKSFTKGFLVPRLTTVQRNAITSPAEGLMVYDTNLDRFYFYTGSAWSDLSSDRIWIKTSPIVSLGTSSDLVGIGTAAPTHKLHIFQDVNNTDGTDGNFIDIQNPNNSYKVLSGIRFQNGTSANTFKGGIFYRDTMSWGRGDLVFANNPVATAGNVSIGDARLVLRNTGNIEILGRPDAAIDDPLFEVKNKYGEVVFGVYHEGVRIYVDDTDDTKGTKGGFAVGGFSSVAKGVTHEYLKITPDSVRIYVDDTGLKGTKGGFAVGGFNNLKAITNEYLRISPDSVRVYVDNDPQAKGTKGGFAVGGFSSAKGDPVEFMHITPENYFIGHESGLNTVPSTINDNGKYNNFFGYWAGKANTSGRGNTFIGREAGLSNTGGYENIFIGNYAGQNVVAGYDNVYIGNYSGAGGHGQYNVYIGHEAGLKNSGGSLNVIIGKSAGEDVVDSDYNVFVGCEAGWKHLEGNYNTFIGEGAGATNVSGKGNVFIGYRAGYNELDSNKLYIDNSTTSSPLIYGDFLDNRLVINGNDTHNPSGYTFYVNGTAGGDYQWNIYSDERLKKNISTILNPLDKILHLRGVTFEWKDPASLEKGVRMGFVAQEAVKHIPEVVNTDGELMTMQYAPITALLVEAVKEQQKIIEDLKTENANLMKEMSRMDELQEQIDQLKSMLNLGNLESLKK